MFLSNSNNSYKLFIGFSVIIIIISNLSLSLGKTKAEQAINAYSFVDSIGIAVHLSYVNTSYGKYDEIIKPMLQELGIRHIRDGILLEDFNTQQKFNDLATLGIQSTLVMDPRDGNTPSRAVSIAKSISKSIEAVEGPNEWDINPELEYKGQTFPQGVVNFQNELYLAIKKDPLTSNLPVLSPSLAGPHNALQLGKISCDINNFHHYPYESEAPSMKLYDIWLNPVSVMCGNQSFIATEFGYHNAMQEDSDFQRGVSEITAAKYLLRLFLEYSNQGIKRAYNYELIDLVPNPENNTDQYHFGLLRNDGSRKPAFIALKNLIALLKDSGEIASNSLKSLDYNLVGDQTNIHHTLLQKKMENFTSLFGKKFLASIAKLRKK